MNVPTLLRHRRAISTHVRAPEVADQPRRSALTCATRRTAELRTWPPECMNYASPAAACERPHLPAAARRGSPRPMAPRRLTGGVAAHTPRSLGLVSLKRGARNTAVVPLRSCPACGAVAHRVARTGRRPPTAHRAACGGEGTVWNRPGAPPGARSRCSGATSRYWSRCATVATRKSGWELGPGHHLACGVSPRVLAC